MHLTESELDVYYRKRDQLVDEFDDTVLEAELMGLGSPSPTQGPPNFIATKKPPPKVCVIHVLKLLKQTSGTEAIHICVWWRAKLFYVKMSVTCR